MARNIHWHIAANVWYLALDEKRQEIAWVGVEDRNGEFAAEYIDPAKKTEVEAQRIEKEKRLMDCVDCHNWATHIFRSPEELIDTALIQGKIDSSLPFIKREGVRALDPPNASVTLKAMAEPLDGSIVTGYKWTQIAGVTAKIDEPDSDTITVTLNAANAYKSALLTALNLQDRFIVQAINPHALEAAETATFKVTVTTSSGTYSDAVNVAADLPYVVNGGLADVPVGLPVLVHGKTQSNYDWALTAPSGSKAAVDNSKDQHSSLTPDVAGKYVLTEKSSGATLEVYAGTWAGAVSGVDAKGLPLSAGCTICPDDKIAPDKFTAWKESGHAEIFTQNINNPAGHWTEACATCHTVGYDPAAQNNGFDEAMTAEGWKVPSHGEVGYYAGMLKQYPKTASLANIQCESCHGPNNTVLHANKTIDAARVSLSSDACGACHGEPLRHGRFQQWEESGHSGIESATTPERAAASASCTRCHGVQGFLTWLEQGDLTKQIQGAKGNATVDELKAMGISADTVLPVTCVTCHMVESPPPAEFSYNLSGTNHSFEASTTICSSCHSATLNAKALEEGTEAKMERLAHKMSEYLLNKMPATITIKDYTPHIYLGKSYDLLSDALVVSKDNIAALEPTEPHGQQGFFIKFKSPLTFTYKPANETPHSVSLAEAEVRLGDITTDGTKALIPFTDVLVKAGWNYFLIHGDASEGIHNPAFVNAVLDASIAALK